MQAGGTIQQMARWTALGALFLLPFAPLIVANSFFFPFITGKAFYLRILIEVVVAAWVVLALIDKAYRPRFSLIGALTTAFVLWMFIADSLALNPMKAFWSNFERMEGWILLIHLLGFFFAASAVLRVEEKWRAWFLTSLFASLLVSFYALLQLAGAEPIHQGSTRIDATLGNSAYFGVYLLFNVFIGLWLALTENRTWLKWILIGYAVLEAVLIFYTGTRGTVIGLVVALTLAAALTAMTAGKRARGYAVGALLLIATAVGGFYLARDSSFVQNNVALQRLGSISLDALKPRLAIWNMALEGMKERPIIGWGQEGFNYIFNTHYDPSMYRQEPWFDRAHNAFLDWLTAGGVPAFLLYISLFGSAIMLLWKYSELSRPERILLTAAFVGYGIHNVFVFDNLYSYIYFFSLLALIHSQVARPIPWFENAPTLTKEAATTYALPIAVILLSVVMWSVNITGMNDSAMLIKALSGGSPKESIGIFNRFAERGSFAMQEIREQMISYAATVVQSEATTPEEKQQMATLAVTQMQKQVEAYPRDARSYMQLAYGYRIAQDGQRALAAMDAAIVLSPNKQQFWIEKGLLELDMGNMEAARKDFYTAYNFAPEFGEVAIYAAAGDFAVGDTKAADALLLKTHGTTNVDNDVLATVYVRTDNWPRLIALWQMRANNPARGPEAWFSLAAAHYLAGNKSTAIASIQKAMSLYPNDPNVLSSGAAAIKQIQEGK